MFLSASPVQFTLQAKRFQLSPASSESTISINMSQLNSDDELDPVRGEQQVDDELTEMRNYDDELPEMRNYDDELTEMRNYDDELPETRNYDDELTEMRNYDDELPETRNYDVPQMNSSDSSDKEEGHAQKRKREKKVKTDARVECLVCHSIVNRMDRHILKHSDVLNKEQQQFIKDFFRTRNSHKLKTIYDCTKCFRRFASVDNHKYTLKCSGESVVKVDMHWSRSSLPKEIKMAIKSLVLPTDRELEIAQRFVDYKTDLAKCGGEDKKWSQDRHGNVKMMAQLYNATYGLKKPELLIKACRDLQQSRNLKPQTMMNYLQTFLLFVKYCYLAKETNSLSNEQERMYSAISDARKAFSPAASENSRKVAESMMERVPSSQTVRDRYRSTLEILTSNLSSNHLDYKTQQALNFFPLQARINTRLAFKIKNSRRLKIKIPKL